jgi:calcineurin-like phosphoesterase family protein
MKMIWFTSDMHFGHQNIISYCNRPFRDVDEMRETLIRNWNAVVAPDDIVYIVGDAAMGHREMTLPALKRCNGHKYLVPGNHDGCHKMFENKQSYGHLVSLYLENFDDILDEQIVLEDLYRVCHFPYNEPGRADYQGRDYSRWEPVDDGKVLFCGHVHDTWKVKQTSKGTWMINVGADVWNYQPVSFETLKSLALSLVASNA